MGGSTVLDTILHAQHSALSTCILPHMQFLASLGPQASLTLSTSPSKKKNKKKREGAGRPGR